MYHRCHTSTAFSDIYGRDNHATMRDSATVRAVEDYTKSTSPVYPSRLSRACGF